MADAKTPLCPLCEEPMSWDDADGRYECGGRVQHCFTAEGEGSSRVLRLVATDSGEDAELFSTYPWPA